MSRAIFIENVAKKGKLSKAEAKRTVDLVLGEIEAGLKKSKKAGRYTIGNFGTFSIVKRKGRKGRNPQTGEAIRIRASKALRFRPRRAATKGCWGEVVHLQAALSLAQRSSPRWRRPVWRVAQ